MKTHLIAFFCSLLLHLLLWAGLLPVEGTVSLRSSVYEVALAQGAAEDRPISPAMAGAAVPESHPSDPLPHRQPRQANAPLPAPIPKKQPPPARKLAAADANLPPPAAPSTPVSGLMG
ncbi:MAG: hypothetical protein JXB25_07365, partial [Deltaproteobacteria bacterium]|nr:hypothetical protein [Deltaproteobacteria bacterium]